MTSYRKSAALFLVFIVVFQLAVIVVGDIARPDWSHWGDEWHFQNTIKKFGNEISLNNLKHYEEMSTPLPFLAYAMWGRVVGFDLFHLRILSVIIALVTYVLFHRFLFVTLKNNTKAFLGAAFLAVQPYMIGFSIFVYTDMMAILFIILAGLAHFERRPLLMAVAMAMAILSRQYAAFLALAAGLFYLLEYVNSRRTNTLRMLSACVLSIIPFAILFIWWGGPSPDNTMKLHYIDYGFSFHPYVLSLYISVLFVYLLPLIIIHLKRFYGDYRVWLAAVVASAFYPLFPVEPTQPTLNVGITTVGLFHRLLNAVIKNDTGVHVAFYAGFLLAMPVLIYFVRDCYSRLKQKRYDLKLFLDATILLFFAVMPFSYLGWEKYFLPVVPLIILRILLSKRTAMVCSRN